MLKDVPDSNLVLFHMYEKDHESELAETQLAQLKDSVAKDCPVKIETVLVKGDDLIDEIERVVHHQSHRFCCDGHDRQIGIGTGFYGQ